MLCFLEVCGVRKKEEYYQWGWHVSMFLPQAGRACEVGKAFPPPSATFPELKKYRLSKKRVFSASHSYIILNYVPHFCWQKLRGTMAATTILRAIETKGRRGGEKKRKTGCMQAYFFLTSCLPLLYLNTRTSLSFPVSKLVREHYSIIVRTTQYACYASNILMYH